MVAGPVKAIGRGVSHVKGRLAGLRIRLIALVLLALGPALLLNVYTYLEQRRLALREVEANVRRLARFAAASEQQIIQSGHQLLVTLSRLPEVRNAAAHADAHAHAHACKSLFRDLLDHQEARGYANIGLIRADGQVLASAIDLPQAPGARNLGDRGYFRKALESGEFAVGEYQVGRITGKPSLNLAYPVLDDAKEVVSVVFLAINLEWVGRLAAEVDLPPGSTVLVLDRHGVILAGQPAGEGYVGRSAADTVFGKVVVERKPEGTIAGPGLDGVESLFGFRVLGGEPGAGGSGGVYVLVGLPRSAVTAAANRMLSRNLLALALIALLAVAAAWKGGEWFIFRHVRAMVAAARRLAGGDLKARTGVGHTNTELGELAAAFDDMAGALQMDEAEQRQLEHVLRESEARFRSVFQLSSAAILLADDRGRVISCNEASEALFRYGPGELDGLPLTEIMPQRYRDAHQAALQRIASGEPPRLINSAASLELHGLKRGGVEFPMRLSLGSWHSDGRRFYSGIVLDSTDVKRAEEQLRTVNATLERRVIRRTADAERRARELERSNGELEQFAYVASHDLQEPLRMVASYVQLLERRYKDKLDADAGEFIGYAVEGAQRMQGLINDLLAYSRVGSRGKAVSAVDLEAVLSSTLSNLTVAIDEAGARVTHDPLPTVPGDAVQLGQLLQNLIGNAIKFRGERPPLVHVAAERKGDEWVCSVRDNGIGIDPEYAGRIFLIFQRLHARSAYPGSGIGLAVCKKIMERHGGRIWVESVSGEGATFFFTLPAAQVAPAEGDEAD